MISGRSGFIGDGAKRFAGPFVTIAAEPDEDAARVEQLRGHTADHLFKNNRRGSAIQTFSRGSVSAEMAIRSADACISTSLGFKEGFVVPLFGESREAFRRRRCFSSLWNKSASVAFAGLSAVTEFDGLAI
jgi:hypothetical protein